MKVLRRLKDGVIFSWVEGQAVKLGFELIEMAVGGKPARKAEPAAQAAQEDADNGGDVETGNSDGDGEGEDQRDADDIVPLTKEAMLEFARERGIPVDLSQHHNTIRKAIKKALGG